MQVCVYQNQTQIKTLNTADSRINIRKLKQRLTPDEENLKPPFLHETV